LFAAERVALLLALMLTLAATSALASTRNGAPPLPSAIVSLAPTMQARGGGLLTYFGLSVYDGWYWSATPGWPSAGPYALDLHYHRNLDGVKIAERSVDEITRLELGSSAERLRWGVAMKRVFPDIKPGDRLTGVNAGAGVVRFFYNGKPIGEISDPGFADAFFGIWLHPATSRADFRRKLLGTP